MKRLDNSNTVHNNHTLPEFKTPRKHMDIKLVRHTLTPQYTHGKLYIDNVFFAHTLEDTYRALDGDCSKKIKAQTCIDPGNFHVIVTFSNRFKKDLPELLNVPCFEKIRMHGGNTKEDTEGCILVGEQTDNAGKIWNCADKVKQLTARISEAGGATITIVNEPATVV